MTYNFAKQIADDVLAQLEPHCLRIEIAGSIRRKKPDGIKDIEIVAIPKPWGTGLFLSGIAEVCSQWQKVKGDLENKLDVKYTQRILPGGVKLDLFLATPENWGLILAIRTGPAEYSHHVLASRWVQRRYKSINGMLYNTVSRSFVPVPQEADLYRLIVLPWIEPERREHAV